MDKEYSCMLIAQVTQSMSCKILWPVKGALDYELTVHNNSCKAGIKCSITDTIKEKNPIQKSLRSQAIYSAAFWYRTVLPLKHMLCT
jgi:hypothetical protein